MHKNSKYDRMLFDNTVIGLALCRMNGELVDVNGAYAALLGRTLEEALKLTYWEITPEKYASQEKIQLESLEKTGRYGPFEKEYIHADGHFIPVRLSGQIVEIDDEKFIWSSVEDITDHKEAEKELERLYKEVELLSRLDGLTGIANRRMFDQTLEREWSHAQRNQTPISLILIDIDYFKQYNDFYGHIKGDDCLIQVTKALSELSKRSTDLLSRYGGEEFVLLLPEISANKALVIADKCLNAVNQLQLPHKLSSVSEMVSVSAGVSTVIPVEKIQSSTLIECADKLLYQAKKNGRNRFEYKLD